MTGEAGRNGLIVADERIRVTTDELGLPRPGGSYSPFLVSPAAPIRMWWTRGDLFHRVVGGSPYRGDVLVEVISADLEAEPCPTGGGCATVTAPQECWLRHIAVLEILKLITLLG